MFSQFNHKEAQTKYVGLFLHSGLVCVDLLAYMANLSTDCVHIFTLDFIIYCNCNLDIFADTEKCEGMTFYVCYNSIIDALKAHLHIVWKSRHDSFKMSPPS